MAYLDYVPFYRTRIFVGRIIVGAFVFVIFFGLSSIVFFSNFDFHLGFLGDFPKLKNFNGPIDSNFYEASNVLWANLLVFSISYSVVYLIALPCWIFAAVSRRDWTDFRLKWQTFLYVFFTILIAGLQAYEYMYGDAMLIGSRPRLDRVSSLSEYAMFQVIGLMGLANFLLFTATLITSAKIFGRPRKKLI